MGREASEEPSPRTLAFLVETLTALFDGILNEEKTSTWSYLLEESYAGTRVIS